MVDHLPQVVAQHLEQRQHAVVRNRLLRLLDDGHRAHQTRAQPIVQIVRDLHPLLRLGIANALHMLALQRLREVVPGVVDLDRQLIVEPGDAPHLRAELRAQQQRHEHRGDGPRDRGPGLRAFPCAQHDADVMQCHEDEDQPARSQQQMARLAGLPGVPLELQAVQHEDHNARQEQHLRVLVEVCAWSQHDADHDAQHAQPKHPCQSRQMLPPENPGELTEAAHVQKKQRHARPRHRDVVVERPRVGRQHGVEIDHPDQRHQRKPAVGTVGAVHQKHHQKDDSDGTRHHAGEQVGSALSPDAVLVALAHLLRASQIQRANARLGLGHSGHANPDGVHALVQGRPRQLPPARHVPACRQRRNQRRIRPDQIPVAVDRPGRAQRIQPQSHRAENPFRVLAFAAPLDPIPSGFEEIDIFLGPDMRHLHLLPAQHGGIRIGLRQPAVQRLLRLGVEGHLRRQDVRLAGLGLRIGTGIRLRQRLARHCPGKHQQEQQHQRAPPATDAAITHAKNRTQTHPSSPLTLACCTADTRDDTASLR